jgi:plasmid maintenance system antidote protein VapI
MIDYDMIATEENFRIDIQHYIQRSLNENHIDYKQFAKLLNISEKKVNDIFSDKCVIDVRLLARIFFVLNSNLNIVVNNKNIQLEYRRDYER